MTGGELAPCEACRGFERHNAVRCNAEQNRAYCGVALCSYHVGVLAHSPRLCLADGTSLVAVPDDEKPIWGCGETPIDGTHDNDRARTIYRLAAVVAELPKPPPVATGCEADAPPSSIEVHDGRLFIDDVADRTAVASPQGGMKFDSGKIPLELLPEDALELVAKVLQFGAKKYAARNWEKGISYAKVYGSIRRHGKAWFQDREELDPESGLPHLAHLACEALFACAFGARGMAGSALDDRPRVQRFDQPESNGK